MKFKTIITRPVAELTELQAAATRLTERGFEAEVVTTAKVTKTAKLEAILRTNADVRTVRQARQPSADGGIAALGKMMTIVGAKMAGALPSCETKVK